VIAALCTLSLLAPVASSQEPVDATSAATPPWPTDKLYVGGKVGWFQPVGVQAVASVADDRGPRWDLDLLLEPSRYAQSASLGGGFRPLHHALMLGARARWLMAHAPWSRGYSFALDNSLALGPEIGGRWGLLQDDKLLVSFTLGGVFSPWGRAALPPMLTLDLGVGWKVKER
jgi:hypothetical protein